MLALVLLAGNAGATEEVLPRSMHHYALLEDALARYRELSRHPELTRLPALPARTVRVGETYVGIPALRALLLAVGDLPASATAPSPAMPAGPATEVLDASLAEALQRFQERHGLQQDGALGPATWRALTTPLTRRTRQIELTLARWRGLPANPHQRAIFINIPRFRLYAMNADDDHERDVLAMDVVAGRAARHETPVFAADLTHLIFRPYWDVPRSIVTAEILPAVRRSPGYLERHQFEIVDADGRVMPQGIDSLLALTDGSARVRQRPGSANALGAVKFMLPNPYNVYLHDTPEQRLFAQDRRAFSHGCIRVARPAELARWLLGSDPEWSDEKIAAAMQGSEPVRVDLPEPVRVYIVYGTAIAREDGSVLFLDDVYGLDA